jgi:hypothetical protein
MMNVFPEDMTAESIKEGFAAVREWAKKNIDGPVEIIASQEFFDSLKDKSGPVILGVNQLPVRVDTALAAKTAIVRYRSGKLVYLTPDGPRRTPEEEAAAMEKFMAAEPPRGLFDLFNEPFTEPNYGLLDRCKGRDESKEQPS